MISVRKKKDKARVMILRNSQTVGKDEYSAVMIQGMQQRDR
jgi:hypothetical protein